MNTVYAQFLRRWWWLVAIGVSIALVATHSAVSQQQPLYRAQATIEVGRTIQDKNPEQSEFAIMDRLVPAYAELAKRDPILIATAQSLNLPLGPEELRARLLVVRVPAAPLIDIVVVDSDPDRVAAIANEIARQVVLQSPASSQQEQGTQAFISQQLADLQRKISEGQAETAALQDQIGTLTSASDIDEARRKLATLEAQIEAWQASYARLVGTVEPSKTNLVSVLSQAMPPSGPIPARNTLYYALALVIGAGLSILLALGLDLLNNSVTSPRELHTVADGIPILTIPRYSAPQLGEPMIAAVPLSPAAAAYRLVRNTLAARGATTTGMAVAVTSSRVAEGKTTTAVNLAISLANAGRRVVLIDANLHNPELDCYFPVVVEPGLSDLLLGRRTAEEVLQPTGHPKLALVTAGLIPAQYADLLSVENLSNAIAALQQLGDILILDTPALAQEQDSLILARHVSGVLLIAEAGRVQKRQLREAITLLQETRVDILAIALNKVRPARLWPADVPWSIEARNNARAQLRRRAHAARTPTAAKNDAALKATGD